MIKKINIAGIQLDNYSVRESIMDVEHSVETPALYTVLEVTMNTLLHAQTDEKITEVLESVSQTVIAESGILDAADWGSSQRKREIETHAFFFELLKRLERNHKRLFILGNTVEETDRIYDMILDEFPRTEVVGLADLESCMGEEDAIVNEINASDLDVLLSVLPTPKQEYFWLEQKDKISANLWYGMDIEKLEPKRHRFYRWVKKNISRKKLKEHISSYEG